MKSRKLWLNLARLLLSLGTLGWLLATVGWQEIGTVLQSADLRLLVTAWILFLGGIIIRAFRWRALLLGLGLRPPFGRLLYLYFVGSFFNAFLPSGFGGDVVRVLELTQDAQGTAAVGTVFLDRLTGILSLMALGLLVLPFTPDLQPWLVWMLVIVSGGGLVGGFLLLEGRLLQQITARLPGPLSLLGEGKLAQVYAAVTGCGWRAIVQALVFSTCFNLLNIAVYWLCGRAVQIPVGVAFYFVATPLLSLTLLVPLSVGGLGVRDWVAQILYNSVSVSSERAAGMSLGVYIVTAAVGLVGGLLYLTRSLGDLLERWRA